MKAITQNLPAVLVAGAIVLLAVVLLFKPALQATGSTARGSEYFSTTTNSLTGGGAITENYVLNTFGTLGSVIITGAAAGTINLYDATTSNTSLRATSMSTSSVLIASFPASTVAGTYVFDRYVVNGLYISVAGTAPTSTITWRY